MINHSNIGIHIDLSFGDIFIPQANLDYIESNWGSVNCLIRITASPNLTLSFEGDSLLVKSNYGSMVALDKRDIYLD